MEGKYSIELFREGGEGAGLEIVLDRCDNLGIARAFLRRDDHAILARFHVSGPF
jgi:hypothetical protein